MREQILKSVAQPLKLFYAPFLPAVINIMGQMFIMMGVLLMGKGSMVIFFIISICAVHGIIVLFGNKEPHLSSMLTSYSNTPGKTKNIIKEKGNKFIP